MIYCGVRGFVDDIAVADVGRFESEIRAHMRDSHTDLLDHIRTTGEMPNETELELAIEEFKQGIAGSPPSTPGKGDRPDEESAADGKGDRPAEKESPADGKGDRPADEESPSGGESPADEESEA